MCRHGGHVIIAERQIWYLLNTLRDTLSIEGSVFSIDRKARLVLYNDIINQQDNVIKKVVDNIGLGVLEIESNETKGEPNASPENQ